MSSQTPRRVGLREVAARANLSVSAASRALRHHRDIPPATRERVLAAARELGYEPNLLAKATRGGPSMSVGFVVRDISSTDAAHMVLGAESELRERGYTLLLTNSGADGEQDADHMRLLERRRVDGLLLILADEQAKTTKAALRTLPVPAVLIDRDSPAVANASSILVDYATGLETALRHLADLGHTRIALVGAPATIRPGRESAAAVRRIAAQLGLDARIEEGSYTAQFGETAMERLLSDSRPTAVLAGSNLVVFGILRSLRRHRLRVPDDLSLLAVDDVPAFEYLDPPLGVLAHQPRALGQAAAQLLLRLLAGEPPTTVTTRLRFEPRASCGPPP